MKTANSEKTAETASADQPEKINAENCFESYQQPTKLDSTPTGSCSVNWLPEVAITGLKDKNVETAPEGDKPEELTEVQKKFVSYLQDTLGNLLPMAFDNPDGQTEEGQKHLQELQKGLKEERENNDGSPRFGEKTKKAYETYVNWLQQTALPGTLNMFGALGAEPLPGMPGTIKSDSAGKTIVDLGLNTKEIPALDDLKKLNAAFDWMSDSQQKVSDEVQKRVVTQLKEAIVKEGLPQGWLDGADTDPEWAEKAGRHIILARSVRDAVQAQMEFGKATRYNDFSDQLPPGAKLTKSKDGTKTELKLELDLPQTLDESNPANFEKFNKNNWWLEAVKPRLDQVAEESQRPALIWGDIEVSGLHARLNDNDQFIDFVDPKKHQRQPDEWLVKANLLENRFDVKFNSETGKIEVTPTVQAQYANGYLNASYENVGEPKAMKMREYDPEDYVHIQVGTTSQLVKAKDLASFKSERKFDHYGEKVATVAGDVAMLASGTIELALVLKAAMLASRATGVAAFASRRIVLPGLNALSDITLGASGFGLNSAAARESKWGHVANEVRNYAFMGKAGQGLLKAGLANTRFGGTSAIEELLQKGSSKYAPIVYKQANNAGELVTYASLEPLHTAVSDHLRDMSQHRYDVANGKTLVNDIDRRMQIDEKGGKQELLDVPAELISEYGKALGKDRPKDVQTKITNIMNATKDALAPNGTKEQKEELKRQLAEMLTFTKDEIKQLEIAQVGPLKGNDLSMLTDPNKRQANHFLPATRALAEKLLGQRDPDIRRAAETALLLLTSIDTATNQEALASVKTTIPTTVDYGPFISRNGAKVSTPVRFEQHDLVQTISREDIRRSLYRQFEQPMDPGRQLVLAHAMLATGMMKPSHYRAVIKGLELAKAS